MECTCLVPHRYIITAVRHFGDEIMPSMGVFREGKGKKYENEYLEEPF